MRFPPTTNVAASLLLASRLYARVVRPPRSNKRLDHSVRRADPDFAPNHCISGLRPLVSSRRLFRRARRAQRNAHLSQGSRESMEQERHDLLTLYEQAGNSAIKAELTKGGFMFATTISCVASPTRTTLTTFKCISTFRWCAMAART
jgi:hypothetical protein